MSSRKILRFAPVLFALACSPGLIAWDDATSEAGSLPTETFLVREPDGRTYRDSSTLRPPASREQCPASVRVWSDESGIAYAVWWSLRPDSTADLVASTTTDGRTWAAPVRLDTADAAKVGCRRAKPGVYADGDNFHVVYSMRAREGPGVFLSHSMDRGRTFHSPVTVVYGEKPGLASVAADGNFVLVAYEDPNTTPTRISIALSSTMAHLFQYREVISPEDAAASDPRAYLSGKRAMVLWRRADDSTKVVRRTGAIR